MFAWNLVYHRKWHANLGLADIYYPTSKINDERNTIFTLVKVTTSIADKETRAVQTELAN